MAQSEMTYAGSGVNYDEMDPFKRRMLEDALPTANNLIRHGFREVPESRGESAYVVDVGPFYLAFVEEGLGTKNKVAQACYDLSMAMYGPNSRTYHDNVMICNFAMQSNDLSTVGAAPVVSMLHVAAGVSSWFADDKRNHDIATAHRDACDFAGCAWGGGESPALRDIVYSDTAVFAGSMTGVIKQKEHLLLGSRIRMGDVIIIIPSSGIHANGLTLARDIKCVLPNGYLTKMPSGALYGEALLQPTFIYAPLVNACVHLLHYAVNITGHGWRKLMRAQQDFRYVIEHVPEPQEVFTFIQEHGNVSNREAYGNLNMGAGFAFFAPSENVNEILRIAGALNLKAMVAGYVEEGERSVIIQPLGLEYNANELKVR